MPAPKNKKNTVQKKSAAVTHNHSLSLFILALIMVINALSYGTIIPLLYPYASRFGIDPFGLSLLFASFSLAQLIATPILGRLSDKYGRKPVLLFCLLGTSISLAMFGAATNAAMLFFARIMDGITGGNISVAQAAIADVTEGNDRAKAFGILGASFGFGFLAGPALGGLMSQFGLSAPFWLASALALIGTILGIFLLKETLPPTKRQSRQQPLFNLVALVKALFSPTVGILLVIGFLAAIGQNAFILGIQSFTVDYLKFTPFELGLMFTLVGAINIFTQMVLLKQVLTYFKSKKRVIEITLIGSMVLVALLGFHRNPYSFMGNLLILGVCFAITTPVLTGLLSERTEGEDQGIILGINQSYTSLGQIIGPLLAGLVASRISIPMVFGLAAYFFLMSLGATYWLHIPIKHKVNV